MIRPGRRALWLLVTAALLLSLLWLDGHRGGPASTLSRCNLALAKSNAPAADVLIIGSSRSGTAIDPIALQQMLARVGTGVQPTVERLALGHSPLRASHALLERYLAARGAPRVIVLEIMFLSSRSLDRMARAVAHLPPEQYIFRRDVNLMTFRQLLEMPAVAMPFTERENAVNRWHYRLRGLVLRSGALVYEFLRHPGTVWQAADCDREAWTREPEWPADFAFAHGEFEPQGPPAAVISKLEADIAEAARDRAPKPWQAASATGRHYPFDFDSAYRAGEVVLLRSMLDLADRRGISVVLLPLPLFGSAPDPDDLAWLSQALPAKAHVFDLYGEVGVDLSTFWYDDGHLEPYPAGALTTAHLARHLVEAGLITDVWLRTTDD